MSTLTAVFWPTSTAVLLSGGLDGVPREGRGSPISCLCLWEPTHKWRSSEQSWQTLQQSICTSELDLPTQNKTKLLILNCAADVVIDSLLVSFPRDPQAPEEVGNLQNKTADMVGADGDGLFLVLPEYKDTHADPTTSSSLSTRRWGDWIGCSLHHPPTGAEISRALIKGPCL